MVRHGRARAGRRLCLLGLLLLAYACERPSYSLSDSAPVAGGGSSTGGGASTSPGQCQLERVVGKAPIFGAQALSNQLPVRSELYAELSDAEVAALEQGGSLLPTASNLQEPAPLAQLLSGLASASGGVRKQLLIEVSSRFKATRALWPNPWALRLVGHAGSEHMNTARVVLRPEAWIVRLSDSTPVVVDLNDAVVSLDDAIAAPERIAAVYYVIDDRTVALSQPQCETGKRELALGNEAMVESIELSSPAILERLHQDIEALDALFQASRPCQSVDPTDVTFHAYAVCQRWHFYDSSTSEYAAYLWSLSDPVELYKPTSQNLALLVQALQGDLFEPDAVTLTPVIPPAAAGGQGGAEAGSDAGASVGGAAAGAAAGGAPAAAGNAQGGA